VPGGDIFFTVAAGRVVTPHDIQDLLTARAETLGAHRYGELTLVNVGGEGEDASGDAEILQTVFAIASDVFDNPGIESSVIQDDPDDSYLRVSIAVPHEDRASFRQRRREFDLAISRSLTDEQLNRAIVIVTRAD